MENSSKKIVFPTLKNKDPWNYFEKRIRSATELKRLLPVRPVEPKELEAALNKPAQSGKRCIYIHIPFCTKTCTFCGYYKCVNPEQKTIKKYVVTLKNQVIQLGKTEWVKSSPFDGLYFGGGTPTALPANLFFDLLETIGNNLPLASDCEITLESSITDLDITYLERLQESPVTRVSLGIQSFQREIRGKYNRQANREQIQQKIDKIRNAGITNICADLIYNLDGQTTENWQEDLAWIEKFGFTGCSVYPLLPFPNAPLVKSGNYKPPNTETEYHYFKMADDFLTSLPGWKSITPVQYGHESYGSAKYIELQADDADVLALGPGAGGKINGLQYINAFTVNDFIDDSSFPAEKTRIFRWQVDKSALAQKLRFFRKSMMPKDEFDQLFKNEPFSTNYLVENALIKKDHELIKLTQTGKFWSLNIAELFLNN